MKFGQKQTMSDKMKMAEKRGYSIFHGQWQHFERNYPHVRYHLRRHT